MTESFYTITYECHKIKRYQTVKFLEELLEKEQQARPFVERYEIIGVESGRLLEIGKEVVQRKAAGMTGRILNALYSRFVIAGNIDQRFGAAKGVI